MMRPEVACVKVGIMRENCYVICDPERREEGCVLIDPGDEAEKIESFCREEGIEPIAVLLTHGHFDHIGAIPKLRSDYKDLKVFASEDELRLLKDPSLNLSFAFTTALSIEDVNALKDGEDIELLSYHFKLISTPGHTGGSCCYYIEKSGILFSGDTLFRENYGRTDLPTGSETSIMSSIKDKLLKLPDETLVFPGHDADTTIGHEKVRYL